MSLPAIDVADRTRRVHERLGELDALLVTRLPNIRYLTGFTGSAATLLVARDGARFVSDGRYEEQAREQLGAAGCDAQVEISSTGARQILTAAIDERGIRRLGFEAAGVTWSQHRTFAEWFPDVELVPTDGLVEELRRVKEPGEVARVRAACAIGDDAFEHVVPMLATAPTERAVALALEVAMRERGAEGTSFDPIVASGPNSAKPHARPSDRQVRRGELVVLDFGCVVDGYCSDMTRTVSVGDPGPEAVETYNLVLESQRAGREAVAPDVSCVAVDGASRHVIDDAGFGDLFTHGTGHGVGLEIHEAPRVAATSGDTLTIGDVVTVEPGVYRPGVGGVRIEDTVVVTPGGADVLTSSPKELVL